MANKITCTCGHSWNKSDSSKKDATVCHICGKDNTMKNGGWLNKYNDVPEAQMGTMVTPLDFSKPLGTLEGISEVMSAPARTATYLLTGKYQDPSQALGIKNPWGALAADMILDPVNLIGAGSVAKQAIKFKPKPGMMYRGLGEEGMKDALESGVFKSPRGLDKTYWANANEFDYAKNYSKTVGNDLKVGKSFIAEYPKNKANFYPEFKGRFEDALYSKDILPIDEGKILKKDWLRGYKEVPKPKKKQDGGWLDKFDVPQAQNGITLPVIEDIGDFKQGVWVPNLEAMAKEAKRIGAKKVKTKSGAVLYFNDNWEVVSADDAPKAQNGIEGTMGGLTDKGFNYNGAWGGPSMQFGGNLNFLEPTSKKLPEGYNPKAKGSSTEYATSIGGEDGELAYLIPEFKYGKLLDNPKAEFRRTGEHLGGPFKTWQEADEWERTVRHPYVEKGQNIPTPLKRWGKDFAMGGSLPGTVGFTYARTGDIPSNGPYAKKTKASAQDGKEVEYKELPEITVVGSKDKQTRDFYNNLIDKFSENEITSGKNPFVDARVMGQYLGIMNMGKKYGFPKVKPETKSGVYKNARGHYNPLTKTIYANSPENWVAEMAHHVQMKDDIVGKGLQWLGNDLVEYIKQPIASIKGEKLPSPYTKEGTVEHEAHSIIQPMLEEKAMRDYEKYRDSELARSREKRFLLENRNLQNGGEMKFYQEGLDWKPRNISKDGSEIKKDDNGYWNPDNWGEPVEIGSNDITMQGVYEPLLGVSDTGDTQIMYPGEDYKFKGKKVTEYPIKKNGGWLDKYK